ncbi:MAG: type III secretion inner membrane ring lipoprotein SctJ [Geminicoccaceae bacterium]|nr:type III secretion inner membrane ring lipoprotein SctJ [Geminicoccaceae bacterium]
MHTAIPGARALRLALSLLTLLVLAGCKTDLYGNLSERDANEMAAILLDNGIDVDREIAKDGTITLFVEKSDFASSVRLLTDAGYPRESFMDMGTIFGRDGLISSPVEERARFIFALSQELSDTLSRIDGVLSARVHIVLPDNNPFRQAAMPSSASVFIRHLDSVDLGMLVPEIKTLVANGIEGVVYDNVSVALFPAKIEAPKGEQRHLANFAGIRLDPSSYNLAAVLILGLLALTLVFAAAASVMFLIWRRRPGELDLIEEIRQLR